MVKRIGLAEAKAKLSAVVESVREDGDPYVIERHGKAVAAVVPIEHLEHLEQFRARSARPLGALALIGAWEDVEDAAIDAFIADVMSARERDTGRKVRLKS